eukprot:771967-Prymnesium_polylepis.1
MAVLAHGPVHRTSRPYSRWVEPSSFNSNSLVIQSHSQGGIRLRCSAYPHLHSPEDYSIFDPNVSISEEEEKKKTRYARVRAPAIQQIQCIWIQQRYSRVYKYSRYSRIGMDTADTADTTDTAAIQQRYSRYNRYS